MSARTPSCALTCALSSLALCVLLVWAPAPAAAHSAGSQPLYASGNATLAPDSDPLNSSLHQYLAVMGMPTSPGDTLQFNWSVNNGTGPALIFEIHNHVNGYTIYYNRSASALADTWRVPDNTSFMVLFQNPWNFSVFLTYSFVLQAPNPDFSPFLFMLPAGAGVALGWFFFVRAGRGAGSLDDVDGPEASPESPPTPGEGNRLPETDPAPPDGDAPAARAPRGGP